jgi:sarcosine oxidase subunit gamma
MSEVVSALNKATFTGIAAIEECGLQGMITLRGDLYAAALRKAAAQAAGGAAMPAALKVTGGLGGGIAWMAPDEALILCPHAEVEARVAALSKALAKSFAMAVNVSDARAVFRVSGPAARDVMAKLCPLDLSADAFGPGDFRRTRMAQIAAALWMQEDGSIGIICFRSVAQYAFDLLSTAAAGGSEVGYHAAP